jgi:hypothetical protein
MPSNRKFLIYSMQKRTGTNVRFFVYVNRLLTSDLTEKEYDHKSLESLDFCQQIFIKSRRRFSGKILQYKSTYKLL